MFGLLTKISGLVWGTGENEGTSNVAHAQQHTSLADDNTRTNSNEKPTARLRKDLYGKVTRLYDGAGVIEEDVYFTFDCVIGGIRPQVGTGVHAEAWRETETSGWKATRVQVITEWNLDDENISNTVETFIGTVTNITTDRGVVDEDITFELSCVRAGYTPYQGDWVKLDLERIPDGTVEVKGVMPLREKSFTGTVSSVSSGFGYIDDDVFFSCGVCSRGFRARRGDAVRVTAVESRQGRAVWRAIKVEPKRQSSTLASPSPHSQVFMGGRMAELISGKEGITISDQLDYGNVLLGESKSLDVLIRNNSAKAHTLQSCSSIRPSLEFAVYMADDTPAPSRPQDKPSQPQPTTSLKDRSLPVKELEIPPSQAKRVVVVFNPRNLGRINHLLVFNFGGFEIGRYLAANVQDADQAILQPCAPYQRSNNRSRDAWRRFSELTSGSGEECIIPGEKPLRKRKLFLPVKLSLYSIPRDIRRCLLDGRDLGSIVHSLREPLSLKNYAAKFSALLYAEELQMEMDMRQFDMTRVSMNTCGEFLSLQVPGLAEGRPSLLIGDKIVVSLSGSSSNSPKYEGYIHEIRKDDVMLKFCEEFHHRFAMQECDVMFYFNRTTLRRCHRAVEFAVSLGEEVLFPKKLSAKLPVFSLNFRSDLSTSEMKTCAKPGESINHRKNEETFLYNGCLNERQKAAVCRIAGGQCRPTPYLLFGPPGTGKTITVVEAILQVFHGLPSSRVLACAPSNSAADLIAERLHHSSYIQEGDLVRLNAAQRGQHIPEAIACYCKDTDELDVAAYYRIIVSTCSTAGQLYSLGLRAGHFTHVFVDEAGQATEPDCLVAVGLAAGEDGQVVLAGDPFQLGPVLQSAVSLSYGLNVSLLERLMSRPLYCRDEDRFSDHGCYDPLLVTKLVNNYRSHPAVLRLPSAVFYHDELEACAETQMRESLCQWNMLPRKDFPVIFHGLKGEDVREGSSPSWFNPVEAVQVVKYLQSLRSNDKIPLKLTDIGVITPYRKQVEKLRLLLDRLGLNEVKVGSVEEFQGQERLAIIISTVRSNESLVGLDVRHSVGFLSNPKRFNVAITRAQALLVVVGNPHVLCQDPYWCCLLQYCVMNDAYVGCDLPSLDQQFLRDEFKEAMELLSRTITYKNNPSENTNSFISSEITENKETQEETENPHRNSDIQADYHKVVHKGIPCTLKGSNLPSRDFVDKSSILGSNQKSKTAVAESKSRIPRGDYCDNEESDQAKFRLGQKKQYDMLNTGHGMSNPGHGILNTGHGMSNLGHGMLNTGHGMSNPGHGMLNTGHGMSNLGHGMLNPEHTGVAVSSDITTGLEGSYSKTTKTKTLSELQDADSDDELEEFVFKPRNNRE